MHLCHLRSCGLTSISSWLESVYEAVVEMFWAALKESVAHFQFGSVQSSFFNNLLQLFMPFSMGCACNIYERVCICMCVVRREGHFPSSSLNKLYDAITVRIVLSRK